MKYLLDTNVISEPVKTTPNTAVLEALKRNQNEISIAAPVWHELKFGCMRLAPCRKRELIETFLNDVIKPNVDILPYGRRAAEWHASERARLGAMGLTPPFADGQIAAVAATNNLVLVTRNVGDYDLFSNLNIENWHG